MVNYQEQLREIQANYQNQMRQLNDEVRNQRQAMTGGNQVTSTMQGYNQQPPSDPPVHMQQLAVLGEIKALLEKLIEAKPAVKEEVKRTKNKKENETFAN